MTSEIESILELQRFSKLRRACVQRVNSLGSNLPRSLVAKIKSTATLDDMLDLFSESPYWNWFDTRLLQALVSASGSPEAEEWLENFKDTFYTKKVTEVIPYISIKPFKESINIVEKFDKDPKGITISELLEHKYKLEYEVLDIDEGELVLSCIKTGCVELTWQLPRELIYRAYTSMKRKHDELSSLAVQSLVCEEADEYAGLPILWRGQEVGEIGPIEPLPKHFKQKPYSLPQGFHWATLSSSDADKLARFIRRNSDVMKLANNEHFMRLISYHTTYPNTRREWQFSIQTTCGNLVGVVLAFPVHIHVEKEIKIFIVPTIYYHRKYQNNRLCYMLIKELLRRANLINVNQLMLYSNALFKPITTTMVWSYQFNQPASSQLPTSPRTPGWRRMTSQDVPIALALINKWSSQFKIRQVFNSEEELVHKLQKHGVTYIVNDKLNNITDLISFMFFRGMNIAHISMLISTQSPVKQLIIDALVCARDNGVKSVTLNQYNIESDIISSLLFQSNGPDTFHLYNYRHDEISQAKFWIFAI